MAEPQSAHQLFFSCYKTILRRTTTLFFWKTQSRQQVYEHTEKVQNFCWFDRIRSLPKMPIAKLDLCYVLLSVWSPVHIICLVTTVLFMKEDCYAGLYLKYHETRILHCKIFLRSEVTILSAYSLILHLGVE